MTGKSSYMLGSSVSEQERLEDMLDNFAQKRVLTAVRPGFRVLDLGCGPGAMSTALAEAVGPSGAVVGVDLQETQLERARRNAAKLGLKNVTFEAGNATALAFEDECFDLVYAKLLVMHLPDPLAGLREMKRVLRRGCSAYLYELDAAAAVFWPEYTPAHRGWEVTMQAMREGGSDTEAGRKLYGYLREVGFEDVRVIPQMAGACATQRRFLDATKRQITGLLDSLREAIVASGTMTDEDVSRLRREVLVDDPNEYISTVGVDCWGTKPT